ncbi:2232_t:CDS:2, partial [Scutellospora calospora]
QQEMAVFIIAVSILFGIFLVATLKGKSGSNNSCDFTKNNVRYNDIDMLVTTLQQSYKDHIGVMVSNQGYSGNANEKGNKFKIMMCKTDDLIKKLMDHIDILKKENEENK